VTTTVRTVAPSMYADVKYTYDPQSNKGNIHFDVPEGDRGYTPIIGFELDSDFNLFLNVKHYADVSKLIEWEQLCNADISSITLSGDKW